MDKTTLSVVCRQGSGKGEARKLRQAGQIPGIMYGRSTDPLCVVFEEKAWRLAVHDGLRIGRLVELSWEGSDRKNEIVLVRDVQIHPVTDAALHVDFQMVLAGEQIEVQVPLSLDGIPVGVKDEGGWLEQLLRKIIVKCVPSKIPETITVDVTNLRVGETLHVADVTWDEGDIVTDGSLAVATIGRAVEEEEEPAEPEEEVIPETSDEAAS